MSSSAPVCLSAPICVHFSRVGTIHLGLFAQKIKDARVLRHVGHVASPVIIFFTVPAMSSFPPPDQCPELRPQRCVDHRQRLDQPTVQLEQPGSRPVTQTAEASVRGAVLSPLRGGRLLLGRRRGRGRRRRRVDGGRRPLPGPDGLHVPVADPTQEDGVDGDSQLHGVAPRCSAAGRCDITISFISRVQWMTFDLEHIQGRIYFDTTISLKP